MKPLVKWTLWRRRWFSLWWYFAIFAFVALVMAFYPPFRDQAAQFDQQFTQQIPEGAKAFISDTQDFLSPIGYLSSQIYYIMLPMLLSILSITLGSSLIAREEREGTIELLLSRPLSRSTLLAGKVVVGTIIVIGGAIVSFLTTVILAHFVKLNVGVWPIAVATISCTLLALAFGAIAFAITMTGRARVASVGIATLIALGGYIISSLAEVATWLKWPSKLMPFHYYHPADMLAGTYRVMDFAVFIGIIIVCAIFSWVAFRGRDIGA